MSSDVLRGATVGNISGGSESSPITPELPKDPPTHPITAMPIVDELPAEFDEQTATMASRSLSPAEENAVVDESVEIQFY